MKKWFIVILVGLLLVACGGDDDDDEQDGGLVSSDSATPTATAAPADEEGPAPEDAGLVVYVADDELFALIDGEPELLGSGLVEDSVWLAPSNRAITFFVPTDGGIRLVYLVDATSQTATPVAEILGNYLREGAWSPDGRWLMLHYAFSGPALIRQDDGAVVELSDLTDEPFGVAQRLWLSDNSLLIADGGASAADGQMVYERIGHLEPDVPRLTVIENPESYESLPAVAEALELEPVFETIPGDYVAVGGPLPTEGQVQTGAPGTCDTWRILHNGDPIYSIGNVYSLTNVTATDDDRLFFIEWTYPDCRLSLNDPPAMRLMMMPAAGGRTTVVVGEGLSPNFPGSREPYSPEPQPSRLAVSPSGNQVIWIGGAADDGYSSLNVTAIEGGPSTTVYDQDVNVATGAGVIRSVYWLEE